MTDIDNSDEPLFALMKETHSEKEAALIQFALTTHISDEVRKKCEAELAAAKKRGYRI